MTFTVVFSDLFYPSKALNKYMKFFIVVTCKDCESLKLYTVQIGTVHVCELRVPVPVVPPSPSPSPIGGSGAPMAVTGAVWMVTGTWLRSLCCCWTFRAKPEPRIPKYCHP